MSSETKIAVAGATGRVGRHLVEVLTDRGDDVVPISRTHGVDVITGEGLAEALVGVEGIVDATTGPSPEQEAETKFFTTAARNLQEAGERAGVGRIVVVSIIGCGQLLDWGTQGDVAYVPEMRTQLVAARNVAEALADLATSSDAADPGTPIPEIAGPRVERLVDVARLLAARRGSPAQVEEAGDLDDPDRDLYVGDGLLPGPHATLAGPTFEAWLAAGETDAGERLARASIANAPQP
jgi:uncharacterized protein YbjT (DUF2867 family)